MEQTNDSNSAPPLLVPAQEPQMKMDNGGKSGDFGRCLENLMDPNSSMIPNMGACAGNDSMAPMEVI